LKCTATWKDCRPRVAGRSRLRSWRRHRDQTWSFLSVHGRHRIFLVELTCPWETDADKARDRKISRYGGPKEELSYQGWDCGLYTIEVGARGHISKEVKDRFWSLFRSWVPPGHRSGVAQMIKYASWISLVCLFSIFQTCNYLV
jgi:hypothetical protein